MRTLGLFLLAGCATVPPAVTGDDARRSLLAAHAVERQAHLARDADPIARLTAEGFLMLDRGEIRTFTVAEMRDHFARYFGRVTFDRWDDLEPPRAWVSADGTWGSVAVRKEVITRGVTDGSVDRAVFAWLETWECTAQGWKLRAVASTRAAEPAR
ncbi:MAG TPA: hypothetical protein VFD38_03010 [Myxococcaceae bacterium]|nr:hypothetical protein [Myxococcaceae bacterium]